MQPKALPTPQAAAYCGFSKSYFDHLRIAGDGPPYIKVGSRVRYLVSDLDRWLESMPRYEHGAAESVGRQS